MFVLCRCIIFPCAHFLLSEKILSVTLKKMAISIFLNIELSQLQVGQFSDDCKKYSAFH